jgi:hypothetical protein
VSCDGQRQADSLAAQFQQDRIHVRGHPVLCTAQQVVHELDTMVNEANSLGNKLACWLNASGEAEYTSDAKAHATGKAPAADTLHAAADSRPADTVHAASSQGVGNNDVAANAPAATSTSHTDVAADPHLHAPDAFKLLVTASRQGIQAGITTCERPTSIRKLADQLSSWAVAAAPLHQHSGFVDVDLSLTRLSSPRVDQAVSTIQGLLQKVLAASTSHAAQLYQAGGVLVCAVAAAAPVTPEGLEEADDLVAQLDRQVIGTSDSLAECTATCLGALGCDVVYGRAGSCIT